ncbi:hypothetical protein SAMN05428977_100319 [Nitrosomonas sp. Nm166]|nr:hypothetical protein SAMN05428977_100319 [Nitrosomonas sp. Nm166]
MNKKTLAYGYILTEVKASHNTAFEEMPRKVLPVYLF